MTHSARKHFKDMLNLSEMQNQMQAAFHVKPDEELFIDGKLRIPSEIPIKPFTFEDYFNGKKRNSVMDDVRSLWLRNYYISQGMFAFVSWRWVKPLTEFVGKKKVLEVMAGRGILAYALRELGVDIIATDDFSFARASDNSPWDTPVTEVLEMDALEAIEEYGSQIEYLLVSWPYPNMALKTIRKMYEVNPNAQVIFIGEFTPANICSNFEKHFIEIDNPEFDLVSASYEHWEHVNDRIYLGKYTP